MAPAPLLIVLLALIAIPVGIVAVIYLIVPLFKGISWLFRQIFRFIFGELGDALRLLGALITQLFFIPLVLGNILIGRWSAAAHFGRAIGAEFRTAAACLYRMAIGHPARLLCLNSLVDGIEQRVPQAIAAAPGPDKPSKSRTGQFEGYQIVGSLPGGGSGGKLYIAQPDAIRLAGFARAGQADVRQVVIKTFSLKDGSSLPQIVRESRALEAAKRLGLVLDHDLNDERFYYVMRYVPGESLGLVTQRLHAFSGSEGLAPAHLRQALGYSSDLLRTLDQYHRGGLWHKDVKPDNIIVDGSAAHLVDFGLVTPLRSGMTLTTHGTEYFRDPEMVRMALKGVKVHQVDGAKFDVYAAGAVLFSMIENSFPAHGGLSQIGKRCPEAVKWIVRRAMTEYDRRYTSAAAMLADIEAVRNAADPFAVRPADLPSMRGAGVETPDYEEAPIRPAAVPVGVGAGSDAPGESPFVQARAGSPVPPAPMNLSVGPSGRSRPKIKVNRWWTGGYQAEASAIPAAFGASTPMAGSFDRPLGGGRHPRAAAADQLKSAQARVAAARERAQSRMASRRGPGRSGDEFKAINAGVVAAVLVCLVAAAALASLLFVVRKPTVTLSQDFGPDGSASVMIELPAPVVASVPTAVPPVPPALPGAAEVVSKRTDIPAPRVVVNNASISGAAAAPHGQGRVLVMSDVKPLTPAISASIERLRQTGFSLLGTTVADGSEANLEELTTLEAEARAVKGIRQLDAPDVSSQMSDWIRQRANVDLVVWFAPSPEKNGVRCVAYAPSLDHTANPVAADKVRRDLLTATSVLRGDR